MSSDQHTPSLSTNTTARSRKHHNSRCHNHNIYVEHHVICSRGKAAAVFGLENPNHCIEGTEYCTIRTDRRPHTKSLQGRTQTHISTHIVIHHYSLKSKEQIISVCSSFSSDSSAPLLIFSSSNTKFNHGTLSYSRASQQPPNHR